MYLLEFMPFCEIGRLTRLLPQLGNMLLFLIVGEDLPGSVTEGQGVLTVKCRSVTKAFGVLVCGELTRLQYTVQVVPGPESKETKARMKISTGRYLAIMQNYSFC